jgi:DNA polymerase III delta prime subunit
MLLTIVGASVGIAELHCACVARDQQGMLLAGPSGAGKSTLALALAQQGFGFLSDDRTFCFAEKSELRVWGLPTLFKLRPEAIRWFDELREKPLTDTRNGGPAFWLEPKELRGVERVRHCRPSLLIFLERWDTSELPSSEFRLSQMSSAEALSRLNAELMTEPPEAAAKRSETIKKVTELPCWLLQYGGQPHRIARELSQHFVNVGLCTAGLHI